MTKPADENQPHPDSFQEVMARIEAVLDDPSMTVKGVRPRRRVKKEESDPND